MQVNRYFEDHVVSVGFENNDGTQSVGVMQPGTYTFATSQHETMTVITGSLTIKRDSDAEFVVFSAGSQFEVPTHQEFEVQVQTPTAYLCHYA